MKRTANVVIVAVWLALVAARVWPHVVEAGEPPPFVTEVPRALVVSEQTGPQSLALQALPFAMKSAGIEWRSLDDDFSELAKEAQWVRDAYGVKRDSLPWIVIATPETGYSGPLPATPEDIKALVGRFAQ